MFKAINRNILILIFALAVICGGGLYSLYKYLVPMRMEKEAEVDKVHSEIEERRREVARLKEEFVLLQAQLRNFKDLEASGFFNNQNRVKAQESFDKLRDLSGILNTRYAINSGRLVEITQAQLAKHVVVESPVSVDIDSLDDVDVYTFIKALQERFPGNVDLTNVSVSRTETFSPAAVRRIGAGEPLRMISAKVNFDWRTLANSDRLDEADTSSAIAAGGVPSVPVQTQVNTQVPQAAPATASPIQTDAAPTVPVASPQGVQ